MDILREGHKLSKIFFEELLTPVLEATNFLTQYVKDFSAKYSVSCDPVYRVACVMKYCRLDSSKLCSSILSSISQCKMGGSNPIEMTENCSD